jgi:pyridoxamine 5'-phosphate oxidase
MKKVDTLRREYGQQELREQAVSKDPFTQFAVWFEDAIREKSLDANAMVLSTVDDKGLPDSRVVLLKGFEDHHGFIFFTDYTSPKSHQAEKSGVVALNFYWREFARQVRIRGHIKRVSRQESELYFASRPRDSQISTAASHQSEVIQRDAFLKRVDEMKAEYQSQDVPCPENWGGYSVVPFEFEFFQGRDNRLNDRLRYQKINDHWKIERLSP